MKSLKIIKSAKTFALICIAAVSALLLTSCGGGERNYEADVFHHFLMAGSQAPPIATPVPATARAGGSGWVYQAEAQRMWGSGAMAADSVEWQDIAGQAQRHVIQTASVELESENAAFDGIVAALRETAPSVNGYVESEMLTGVGWRRFTIVLRVPSAYFETVLRHVEGLADLRAANQWAEDVTDSFYDMISRLETRLIEEERVLALIETANNISDLLALEARLSNVRQAIESYQSQLNNMAGRISYSTITATLIALPEEDAVAAVSLGNRVGGAFGDSVDGAVSTVQNFIVFMAGAVIPLGILGLLIFAGFKCFKFIRKKLTA